jgi:hypothetical protein
MTPLYTSWSVAPWRHHDTDPPTVPTRLARELTERIADRPDDARVMIPAGVLRDLLAAASTPEGGTPGAQIHDHDRDVTYRATVDPERGRLDHLEVIVHGWFDDNAMRRVPVDRIRREVLAQVAADKAAASHGDAFTLVLPGGLSERPDLAEVARLIGQGWDRARFHAAYPDTPKRTVDGWMRRARRKYPMTPGGTSAGSRERKNKSEHESV